MWSSQDDEGDAPGIPTRSTPRFLWSRAIGGEHADWIERVAVDVQDNVYLAGGFLSSAIDLGGGSLARTGHTDMLLGSFDSDG